MSGGTDVPRRHWLQLSDEPDLPNLLEANFLLCQIEFFLQGMDYPLEMNHVTHGKKKECQRSVGQSMHEILYRVISLSSTVLSHLAHLKPSRQVLHHMYVYACVHTHTHTFSEEAVEWNSKPAPSDSGFLPRIISLCKASPGLAEPQHQCTQ